MRKTICYCDFCHRETRETDVQGFGVEGISYEICRGCIIGIIRKVIKEKSFVLSPWCKVCKGSGSVKESRSDYDHVTYETIKCEACKL